MTTATTKDWREWLAVISMAGGLGYGGSFVQSQLSPPRPDPFTGAMASDMRKELVEQINRIDLQGSRAMSGVAARVAILENFNMRIDTKLDAISQTVSDLRVMLAGGEHGHTEKTKAH